MHYRHIIFDIDGTLLDTENTGLYSLQKTVKDILGKEMPLKDLYTYFGVPSGQAVIDLNFPDPKAASVIWEENFQALSYLIVPFPEVDSMLRKLKKDGAAIGVVTSRNRYEYLHDQYMNQWEDVIDYSICSEDTIKHKPFPDPMLAYISKSGAKPEECLYIGDTIHDYYCGHSAGVDFALAVWKESANLSSQKEAERLADYVVHDAAEILSIV